MCKYFCINNKILKKYLDMGYFCALYLLWIHVFHDHPYATVAYILIK